MNVMEFIFLSHCATEYPSAKLTQVPMFFVSPISIVIKGATFSQMLTPGNCIWSVL